MKYFVKWECTGAKAGSVSPEESARMGEEFTREIERIERSGKMKDGGPLLGSKGGYFIFEVDKPSELLGLLGHVFWENFQIETYPVLTFRELSDYMEVEYKKAA